MGELVSLIEFRNTRADKLRTRYHALMDKAQEFENRGLHAFKDAIVKSIIQTNQDCRKYGVSKWETSIPVADFENQTQCDVVPPDVAEYLVIHLKIFPQNHCLIP